MKLIMDGEVVSGDAGGVAHALDLAREHAARSGRLIIEVYADGSPAGALLDAPPADAAGVGELGVTTADRSLFLGETLRDALDALDAVAAQQKHASESIDRGAIADAVGAVRSVVEGWQSVRAVVEQSSMLLGIDAESLDAEGSIAGFSSDLVSMRDALSREDWSALGDVLGYDLAERAGSWRSLIESLIARTDDAGSGGV